MLTVERERREQRGGGHAWPPQLDLEESGEGKDMHSSTFFFVFFAKEQQHGEERSESRALMNEEN